MCLSWIYHKLLKKYFTLYPWIELSWFSQFVKSVHKPRLISKISLWILVLRGGSASFYSSPSAQAANSYATQFTSFFQVFWHWSKMYHHCRLANRRLHYWFHGRFSTNWIFFYKRRKRSSQSEAENTLIPYCIKNILFTKALTSQFVANRRTHKLGGGSWGVVVVGGGWSGGL